VYIYVLLSCTIIDHVSSQSTGSPDVPVKLKPNPLNSWTNTVAKKWVNDDTLKLIKFCFGGDAGISQTEIESLESFPEVFQYVLDKRYKEDVDAALGRIAHILDEVCGHRKYGVRALEHLKDKGIERPSTYAEKREPKIVQLYQCIAKICSRFESSHEKAIRRVYAKSFSADIDSNITKNVLSLFHHLIRNHQITVEDQKDFVDKMCLIRAQNLLIHLKRYRQRNNLSFAEYREVEETCKITNKY